MKVLVLLLITAALMGCKSQLAQVGELQRPVKVFAISKSDCCTSSTLEDASGQLLYLRGGLGSQIAESYQVGDVVFK